MRKNAQRLTKLAISSHELTRMIRFSLLRSVLILSILLSCQNKANPPKGLADKFGGDSEIAMALRASQ
jgi:hypothetical protein